MNSNSEAPEPDHEGFIQRMEEVNAELDALVSDARAAVDRQDRSARDPLVAHTLAVVTKVIAVTSEADEIEQWHLDQASVARDARRKFNAVADQLLEQASMPPDAHGR